MSNLIKAYSVRYDVEDKKTIDFHLQFNNKIETIQTAVKSFAAVENNEAADGEFVEGLKAVVVEPVLSEKESKEQTNKILEDANKEAEQILYQAKKDAELQKNDIFDAEKKRGYEEGMQQAKLQTQKLKAEYDEKGKQLQQEYEAMAAGLEPEIAGIISALVEKLTGIVVEDQQNVIYYLVEKALRKSDKCNEYTVKVSKEDYDYISERKDLLLEAIGREVVLSIAEDPLLGKNQCQIEADTKIIDCSLDVQLNNLITDLRLLARS